MTEDYYKAALERIAGHPDCPKAIYNIAADALDTAQLLMVPCARRGKGNAMMCPLCDEKDPTPGGMCGIGGRHPDEPSAESQYNEGYARGREVGRTEGFAEGQASMTERGQEPEILELRRILAAWKKGTP